MRASAELQLASLKSLLNGRVRKLINFFTICPTRYFQEIYDSNDVKSMYIFFITNRIISINICRPWFLLNNSKRRNGAIYTVGENIIATIKMQNKFCYPSKMVIFSNIAIYNLF